MPRVVAALADAAEHNSSPTTSGIVHIRRIRVLPRSIWRGIPELAIR
jgi:hypothetical protein